ncbi:MAG: radical SAM protein [Planctomycetota bacterium]
MNPGTREILGARGERAPVDPWRPSHVLSELEISRHRQLEAVSTIFLTGQECAFHCLMCDLWRHTTIAPTPRGAIPAQIELALDQLPPARHVKLYNSSNFFDNRAVPRTDWPAIARLVHPFDTVIVENHPRLVSERCDEFQQVCGTQLEVALGLETSHAVTLAKLNKQMTVRDFEHACDLLRRQRILIRVFVLLKPPDTTEEEAVERALDSMRLAFDCGADVCSIIPVRAGNGIMDQLQSAGRFTPPRLSSLISVLKTGLSWQRGRVFADLWDAGRFADSATSADLQIAHLQQLNHTQFADVSVATELH